MSLSKQPIVPIIALCATVSFGAFQIDQARADDAATASMSWLEQDYPYLAIDQALPDALRELGHNLDVTIDVSPNVRGRVRHYEHEGSASEFLDSITAEHRLDWVFDQGRLFVSSADEKTARSWSGGAGAFESVRAALADAALDDPRYPIGFDSGRGEINLFAPPHYMSLAARVIERVLTPAATRTVNVIHGRSRAGGT